MASFITFISLTGEIFKVRNPGYGPWDKGRLRTTSSVRSGLRRFRLRPVEFSYQKCFRDKAISDTQPPPPSPRNSHFLSVNNKTLVGADDLGGESEKLKLADNKYESQLNALRLEEMFKNIFNGATHQDMINLKAEKYTQDEV